MGPVSVDTIEAQLQDVIQDLYEISVGVYAYQGPETVGALTGKMYVIPLYQVCSTLCAPKQSLLPLPTNLTHPVPVLHSKSLTNHLRTLSRSVPSYDPSPANAAPPPEGDPPSTSGLTEPISIPPEVIAYVDSGRNPDIYTREFVELVQAANAELKSRAEAFGSFRDILAEEMASALPEVRGAIAEIAESTRGGVDDVRKEEVVGDERRNGDGGGSGA
ncbi:MAG: hypothetical protein M4579_005335 [Chaenotheca gracillima]|nr:MAG: hypothetical protein M4579_005335 [Chaenotheca gracillima]